MAFFWQDSQPPDTPKVPLSPLALALLLRLRSAEAEGQAVAHRKAA